MRDTPRPPLKGGEEMKRDTPRPPLKGGEKGMVSSKWVKMSKKS